MNIIIDMQTMDRDVLIATALCIVASGEEESRVLRRKPTQEEVRSTGFIVLSTDTQLVNSDQSNTYVRKGEFSFTRMVASKLGVHSTMKFLYSWYVAFNAGWKGHAALSDFLEIPIHKIKFLQDPFSEFILYKMNRRVGELKAGDVMFLRMLGTSLLTRVENYAKFENSLQYKVEDIAGLRCLSFDEFDMNKVAYLKSFQKKSHPDAVLSIIPVGDYLQVYSFVRSAIDYRRGGWDFVSENGLYAKLALSREMELAQLIQICKTDK